MLTYRVPRSIPDNFGAPVRVLLQLLDLINTTKQNTIEIDFSRCQFANPFHLGAIAMLYCESSRGNLPVKLMITGLTNQYIQSYFNTIHFPSCLNTEALDNNTLIGQFGFYETKTYIPIVRFPANSRAPNDVFREKLLEAAGNVIKNQLQLTGDFMTAVKYFIAEMTNNVADHSKGSYGYMFAQYFPQKLYLDLCVIDDGNNIFNSFAESEMFKPQSHVEALEMAVNGYSTKKGQENSRGFGISTSRKMLVHGLGGRFLIWSGAATYLEQRGKLGTSSVELNENHSFPGTFVALRIPLNPNPAFKFYDYVE